MTLQNEQPISCPCCGQRVLVPTPDIVISHYGIPSLQARILRAIWHGKGQPVKTARIFEAMYLGYLDDRPDPKRMYLAFKISLCLLRKKLAGSGIAIEHAGYACGYRLVM